MLECIRIEARIRAVNDIYQWLNGVSEVAKMVKEEKDETK
jgi:hypothetical protein